MAAQKPQRRRRVVAVKHKLTASQCPDGCLVIQGVLPDGKYLVLEVRGKRSEVAFFGEPLEKRW